MPHLQPFPLHHSSNWANKQMTQQRITNRFHSDAQWLVAVGMPQTNRDLNPGWSSAKCYLLQPGEGNGPERWNGFIL